MAHFAEINENNIVINVIKVDNLMINDLPFPDSELIGINFLNQLLPGRTWKQTSINNNFRFRYAGIGYEFHSESGDHGGFCPPRAYSDWLFDTENCLWQAPLPMPADSNVISYQWDSAIGNWKAVE